MVPINTKGNYIWVFLILFPRIFQPGHSLLTFITFLFKFSQPKFSNPKGTRKPHLFFFNTNFLGGISFFFPQFSFLRENGAFYFPNLTKKPRENPFNQKFLISSPNPKFLGKTTPSWPNFSPFLWAHLNFLGRPLSYLTSQILIFKHSRHPKPNFSFVFFPQRFPHKIFSPTPTGICFHGFFQGRVFPFQFHFFS